MSDGYDFEADRPDDHDLIRERRVPADRTGARAYTKWREMLRTESPVFGSAGSKFPITHPWWPFQGHPQNTDRYYDDHCELFGSIPDYVPQRSRGYVPRSERVGGRWKKED